MPSKSASPDNGFEQSKTENLKMRQRPIDEHDTSVEFKAKVIPYDACEDPNAPILAYSGENINLIFNIPKESFLKLAAAAINHLEHDSEMEPSEKSFNQSDNCDQGKSEMSHSILNNVGKNLDGNSVPENVETGDNKNTKTVISEKSSNGILPTGTVSSRTVDNSNKKSSNSDFDCELVENCTGQPNYEIAVSVGDTLTESESNGILENTVEFSKNNYDNTVKLDESKSDGPEHTNHKENDFLTESGVQKDEKMNLSAHSLDNSSENCSELESAWPDINPFTETVKIPVKELMSRELNGTLTKYLNLQFLSEFVVIKITSDSNVLVDAVKYKAMEKESNSAENFNGDFNNKRKNSLSGQTSEESLVCEVCAKPDSLAQGNSQFDSTAEKVSLLEENMIEQNKNLEPVCTYEGATSEIASVIPDNSPLERETSEHRRIVKSELEESISISTETPTKLLPEATLDAANLKSPDITSNDIMHDSICSNLKENNLKNCGTQIKTFENTEIKSISLKIEKQLEELDTNVPGTSPTERLKFTLNDSLRSPCGNVEAKNQTEVSFTDISENLKHAIVSSLEEIDESSDSKNEQCFGKMNREENSCRNSNYIMDTNSKSPDGKQSDATESSPISKCEISKTEPTAPLEESYDSVVKVNEACDPIKNDSNFQIEVSLNASVSLEINIQESEALAEKDDLLEVSTLDKSFVSESEDVKETSNQFSDIDDCEETDVSKRFENDSSKNEVNEYEESETSDIDINSTLKDETNEIFEQSIEENLKTRVIDIKLEPSENDEGSYSEKKLSKYISEADKRNSVEAKDELNTNISVPGKSFSFNEKMNGDFEEPQISLVDKMSVLQFSEKNSEDEYKVHDVANGSETTNEIKYINGQKETISVTNESDVVLNEHPNPVEFDNSNETPSKYFGNESSVGQHSECAEVSNGDTDVKQPENSFVSNAESFMDTTVEGYSESMSEGGDMESDDVKSVASESDDSKDSDKSASIRKKYSSYHSADEVDCAPTRVRTKKAVAGLSKCVIPENTEVKNITSEVRRSTLQVPSKYSGRISPQGRTSPVGRALRSKSLDPQPSKVIDKKHSIVESEEESRNVRAKTPDIISKKDIKTAMRSSPRKLTRATTAECSTSKVQTTRKTDTLAKSKGKLETAASKRSKRGSKD